MANNYCRDAPRSSSVCLRKLGIAKAGDVPLAPCLSSRNFGTEKNAEVLWRATSILSNTARPQCSRTKPTSSSPPHRAASSGRGQTPGEDPRRPMVRNKFHECCEHLIALNRARGPALCGAGPRSAPLPERRTDNGGLSRGRLLLSGRTDLGHKASCGSIRLTSKTRSDTGQNGFSTWS
jgi:hypothetical protein